MFKMTTMSAAIVLAFSAGAAQASVSCDAFTGPNGVGTGNWCTTYNNNFTMLGGGASTTNSAPLTGGNNTTTFSWARTYRTAVVTDGSFNATLSSTTPFSGYLWTAKGVNIYGPGTYVFDAAATYNSNGSLATSNGTASEKYTLVVPTGYVGGHMLFDWSINANIDVVQLWKIDQSWAATDTATGVGPSGSADDPFCGPGTAYWTNGNCNNTDMSATANPNPAGNTANTVFHWVSVDTPSSVTTNTSYSETNSFHGTKMIDGPFSGQSANFNLQTIPVPAAAWLMGSGLIGLVGLGRRRKVS